MKTDTTHAPAPGITRGRKFDQVRDGAAVIFLRDGYAAASVDDIARSARVSKATLYSYFPDKSLMFREVLRATMDSAFRQQPFAADPASQARTELPRVLSDLATWALSEPRLSLLRVMTAESTRFPDDARDYDDALAHRVAAPLAQIIDGWTAPADVPGVRADDRLQLFEVPNIGYQGITINVGNGPRAEAPLGADARVRQALSLSIDRQALNQVVFEGEYVVGNQWAAPGTPYYDDRDPIPARDPDAARALLAEAGVQTPIRVEMQIGNNPIAQQVGQVVQAMAAETGFDISLRATEFATLLSENVAGNFDMSLQGWSGRIDPDANIHPFVGSDGANNDQHYRNAEIDALLAQARSEPDTAARKALYDQTRDILKQDLPLIYLYHIKYFYTMRQGIEGFEPYADGIIRLRGVSG